MRSWKSASRCSRASERQQPHVAGRRLRNLLVLVEGFDPVRTSSQAAMTRSAGVLRCATVRVFGVASETETLDGAVNGCSAEPRATAAGGAATGFAPATETAYGGIGGESTAIAAATDVSARRSGGNSRSDATCDVALAAVPVGALPAVGFATPALACCNVLPGAGGAAFCTTASGSARATASGSACATAAALRALTCTVRNSFKQPNMPRPSATIVDLVRALRRSSWPRNTSRAASSIRCAWVTAIPANITSTASRGANRWTVSTTPRDRATRCVAVSAGRSQMASAIL